MRGTGKGTSRQPPSNLQQRTPMAARLAHEDLVAELRSELNDKIVDLQFHLQEKFDSEVVGSTELRGKLSKLEAGQAALQQRLDAEATSGAELQSKHWAQLSDEVGRRFQELQAQLWQKIGAEASARQDDIKAVRGEIAKRPSADSAGFFSRSSQHDKATAAHTERLEQMEKRVESLESKALAIQVELRPLQALAIQVERLQQIEKRMEGLEEQSGSRRRWLERLQEGILSEVRQHAQEGVRSEVSLSSQTTQASAKLQSRLGVLEQAFQGFNSKLESGSPDAKRSSSPGDTGNSGVTFEDDARDLRPQVEELRRKCAETESKLGSFQALAQLFSQRSPAAMRRPHEQDHVIQEPEPDFAHGDFIVPTISAEPTRMRTAQIAGRDRWPSNA